MQALKKGNPPYIAPSMLSADFSNLIRDIEMVNKSRADLFHIDVMDGVFVPNISFGFPVIGKINEFAEKPLDVHLMIVDPDRYIERFRKSGAEIITVHYEACTHLHRTIQYIRSTGASPGVSLNPHTPVEVLEDILEDLDMVLIMSVNPGFGGQKFIARSLDKVKRLKAMIDTRKLETKIEIDGGVTLENKNRILEAGVDILVAGNTVFGSEDPEKTISLLKETKIN
jgi:ribulose-phosphate 3-epimerase